MTMLWEGDAKGKRKEGTAVVLGCAGPAGIRDSADL